MKLLDHCYGCLRDLVEKAVSLSIGDDEILTRAYSMIDRSVEHWADTTRDSKQAFAVYS